MALMFNKMVDSLVWWANSLTFVFFIFLCFLKQFDIVNKYSLFGIRCNYRVEELGVVSQGQIRLRPSDVTQTRWLFGPVLRFKRFPLFQFILQLIAFILRR